MSSRARRPRAPAASPPQPRKRRRTKKSSVSSSYAALPVQGERVYVRKRPRNNIDSKPPSSSQSQEEQDDPILSQPFTTTKKNRQQRRINLGRGRKTKPRSKRQISWPSDPEPTPQDSHPKGFLAEHKPPTALTLSDDIEEIEDTSPDTVRKITPATRLENSPQLPPSSAHGEVRRKVRRRISLSEKTLQFQFQSQPQSQSHPSPPSTSIPRKTAAELTSSSQETPKTPAAQHDLLRDNSADEESPKTSGRLRVSAYAPVSDYSVSVTPQSCERDGLIAAHPTLNALTLASSRFSQSQLDEGEEEEEYERTILVPASPEDTGEEKSVLETPKAPIVKGANEKEYLVPETPIPPSFHEADEILPQENANLEPETPEVSGRTPRIEEVIIPATLEEEEENFEEEEERTVAVNSATRTPKDNGRPPQGNEDKLRKRTVIIPPSPELEEDESDNSPRHESGRDAGDSQAKADVPRSILKNTCSEENWTPYVRRQPKKRRSSVRFAPIEENGSADKPMAAFVAPSQLDYSDVPTPAKRSFIAPTSQLDYSAGATPTPPELARYVNAPVLPETPISGLKYSNTQDEYYIPGTPSDLSATPSANTNTLRAYPESQKRRRSDLTGSKILVPETPEGDGGDVAPDMRCLNALEIMKGVRRKHAVTPVADSRCRRALELVRARTERGKRAARPTIYNSSDDEGESGSESVNWGHRIEFREIRAAKVTSIASRDDVPTGLLAKSSRCYSCEKDDQDDIR